MAQNNYNQQQYQGGYDVNSQQGYPANNQNNQNGGARTQIIHTAPSNSGKYKTNICRHFRNGNCQLGNTCHFAHGQEDVRNTTDPLPNNIPQQPKVVCNNFKTVKCRYYEKGFCKNQHACCFAHGETDVQFNGGYPQGMQMPAQQSGKMQESLLLISILQNLENVFPNDPAIISKLQYAQGLARNTDQKGAFNIISDIMKDPKRTEEEKTLYNTIYTNAQMYYSQQQQLLQQQYMPYQQMAMQYQNQMDPSFYMQQQQQFNNQQQQYQFNQKTN